MTFPGLEMTILKFHDFSRFSMTVRTLVNASEATGFTRSFNCVEHRKTFIGPPGRGRSPSGPITAQTGHSVNENKYCCIGSTAQVPVQVETRGVQGQPGLPQALHVPLDVDPPLLGGPVQHRLALDLQLLQLQLLLRELPQSALRSRRTPGHCVGLLSHTHTHRDTHTQRHTETHTQRHTHRDTQRHTHTETRTHTETHTHTQTHTHTHTQRHTHSHTETHTHLSLELPALGAPAPWWAVEGLQRLLGDHQPLLGAQQAVVEALVVRDALLALLHLPLRERGQRSPCGRPWGEEVTLRSCIDRRGRSAWPSGVSGGMLPHRVTLDNLTRVTLAYFHIRNEKPD